MAGIKCIPLDLNLLDKRVWVKGIFVECPLGCPEPECPANSVRRLPLSQILEVVNNMTEPQLDAVIGYHCNCQERRLKAM